MLERRCHNYEIEIWDSLVYQAWFNSPWEKMRGKCILKKRILKRHNFVLLSLLGTDLPSRDRHEQNLQLPWKATAPALPSPPILTTSRGGRWHKFAPSIVFLFHPTRGKSVESDETGPMPAQIWSPKHPFGLKQIIIALIITTTKFSNLIGYQLSLFQH